MRADGAGGENRRRGNESMLFFPGRLARKQKDWSFNLQSNWSVFTVVLPRARSTEQFSGLESWENSTKLPGGWELGWAVATGSGTCTGIDAVLPATAAERGTATATSKTCWYEPAESRVNHGGPARAGRRSKLEGTAQLVHARATSTLNEAHQTTAS